MVRKTDTEELLLRALTDWKGSEDTEHPKWGRRYRELGGSREAADMLLTTRHF